MKGFGTLASAADLREKLEHDFLALQEKPADTYAAFNFFVTAEHILDWMHPGDGGSAAAARKAKRNSEVLLQIVSHIANGAKHFEPNPKRHDSVRHVDHGDAPYGFGAYGVGPYGGDLTITLDGNAAKMYGSSISALALATYVVAYWRSQPA